MGGESAQLQGGLGTLDLAIVAIVLLATTALGAAFGGKHTVRDFFLGGRRLPWWAVSASIVATEISALTLVSVPFVVFKPGGNFTYLQITVFGATLARLAIAYWLVPAYYEREIYSPYDFMGRHLGERVRRMASALFALGGVLSQSARVYLTGLVLEIVLHREFAWLAERTGLPSLALAIGLLTAFAVLWTWIGGVVTVIWTDFLLFFVFTAAAAIALWVVAREVGGFETLHVAGTGAQKLVFFDFDSSPAKAYTFWAASIASTWGNVAAYGTDQLMAQRLLCCRNVRDARLALVSSSVAMLVSVLVAFVGVGLFAYYERFPLEGAAKALYEAQGDRIFPIFVVEVVPAGLKGLILAGILAAAISSLDAILAALAQVAVTTFWLPWRAAAAVLAPEREERRAITASRVLVLVFGVLLAGIAYALQDASRRYGSVLDLGLSMAGYTQGALLAGFLLAWRRASIDGSGFLWSAPMSVVFVLALAWHGPRSAALCAGFGAVWFAAWVVVRAVPGWMRNETRGRIVVQTLALAIGLAALAWVNRYGLVAVERDARASGEPLWLPVAFPWYVPAGCTVAFVYGHLLSRRIARDG